MKKANQYIILKALLTAKCWLTILLLCTGIIVKSQDKTLAALGNPSSTPSEMNSNELRSILKGEKQRWKDGKRILIALMKTNTPIGKITSEKIYDMSGDELNKFWLALVFQGKAPAPAFFNSESELENFVAANPGAIGILDKPMAGPDVKAIIIDGQKTF